MRVEQLGRLLAQSNALGTADLPLLGVSVAEGVRVRAKDDGRPAPSLDLSKYKLVLPGDIIMNALGKPHGSIGRSDRTGITSPAYWVLKTSTEMDSHFAHHLLRSHWMVQRLTGLGKNQPPNQFDISWDVFQRITVDLPPIEEQRRIADFLDDRVSRIDRIIDARRQQLVLAAQLRSELMRLGVGGVLQVSTPTKATSIGWLERIHRDGEEVRLSRVVTLQRGVDLTEDQRRAGPVQVVTTAGVVGTHDESISSGPGVVIGRYGSVGNVHWVEGPYWPHNTTLYVLATHGNHLRWIYYLLESFPFKSLQARAAVPGVNRNDMAVEMVPWIPLSLQESAILHLDSVADDFATRASSLNGSIDLLTEYKSSLITAAVTGELDVTTAGSNIPG